MIWFGSGVKRSECEDLPCSGYELEIGSLDTMKTELELNSGAIFQFTTINKSVALIFRVFDGFPEN